VGIAGNDGLADGVGQRAEIEKINTFFCCLIYFPDMNIIDTLGAKTFVIRFRILII
jgi:hypothetical protein